MEDVFELDFKVSKGLSNYFLDIKVKGGRSCHLTIDSSAYKKWTLDTALTRVSRLGGMEDIVNWYCLYLF